MSYHDYGWRPYVSVATRRRRAAQMVAKLQRSGRVISPVTIEGRKIARTFWGESWCRNLEAYSDYVNRLPRGRAYVRNGSVIDLKIEHGRVRALVNGSSMYEVEIEIKPLARPPWGPGPVGMVRPPVGNALQPREPCGQEKGGWCESPPFGIARSFQRPQLIYVGILAERFPDIPKHEIRTTVELNRVVVGVYDARCEGHHGFTIFDELFFRDLHRGN